MERTGISLISSNRPDRREREACREYFAPSYRFPADEALQVFSRTSYEEMDRKLKEGQELSYDDTFAGMLWVLAATNSLVYCAFIERGLCRNHQHAIGRASAFVQAMTMRSAYAELSAQEIAGMLAAASYDLLVKVESEFPVFEMCGMGGDRGIVQNGKRFKTINATTLTSIMLAATGYPSIKHGSGKNTSTVGSTDVILDLGIPHLFTSSAELHGHFERRNHVYLDAAVVKTVHDISSLMNVETINHLVGPLALPISPETRITKILGVNNKISPETAAQVFLILRKKGIANVHNAAVVCGFDKDGPRASYRDSVLDELSPYESEIALIIDGTYVGTYRVTSSDFGFDNPPEPWVESDEATILKENRKALLGTAHSEYLAMNLALPLFMETAQASDFTSGFPRDLLQAAYREAYLHVTSGAGHAWLNS